MATIEYRGQTLRFRSRGETQVRRALACAERYGAMRAAELSGVSYNTIRRWCRKLDIPTRGGLPPERCEMPDDYSEEDPLIPGVPVHHITLHNLGIGYILTRDGNTALVDWGLHRDRHRIDDLTRAEGGRLDMSDLSIPDVTPDV